MEKKKLPFFNCSKTILVKNKIRDAKLQDMGVTGSNFNSKILKKNFTTKINAYPCH